MEACGAGRGRILGTGRGIFRRGREGGAEGARGGRERGDKGRGAIHAVRGYDTQCNAMQKRCEATRVGANPMPNRVRIETPDRYEIEMQAQIESEANPNQFKESETTSNTN